MRPACASWLIPIVSLALGLLGLPLCQASLIYPPDRRDYPADKIYAAECMINIVGKGPDAEGIKTASISCKGAGGGLGARGFRMSVDSKRLGKMKASFEGIQWDKDGCSLPKDLDCLLTFCGDSHVHITQSSIKNVYAPWSTGMICVKDTSSILITDSNFTGNHQRNGTLYLRDEAQIDAINTQMTHNFGLRGAGAQTNDASTIRIISSNWSYNQADFGACVNLRDDSTLWIMNGTLMEWNYGVSKDDNPAGAAFYCRANTRVYIHNNNVFRHHLVEGYDSAGGVMYLQDQCMLEIKNGNYFYNNTVLDDNAAGGVICAADAAIVKISGNNTFYNNTVIGDNCGGGALFVRDDSNLHISDGANFTHNQAIGDVGQGGAIYASNNVNLVIEKNILFDNNNASGVNSQGGGVNTRQNANMVIRKNVTFTRNHASAGGGVAIIGDMDGKISDTVFRDHDVLGHGGSMYLEGSFNMALVNCIITNSRAAQGGGFLATASTASAASRFNLTVTGNTSITNNSASTGGGMSLVSGSTVISSGVLIADNHAAQGGGLSISQGCPSCTASVTLSPGAEILNNTAVVAGGGIYLDSQAVTINEAVARKITRGNTAAFGPDLSLLSDCLPGEVRAGSWCQQCGANLYSFNPANSSCDICPAAATCTGGTSIQPDAGYWHSSKWSTQIHRCPNPEACSQQGSKDAALKAGQASSTSTTSTRHKNEAGWAEANEVDAKGGSASEKPTASGGVSSTRALKSTRHSLQLVAGRKHAKRVLQVKEDSSTAPAAPSNDAAAAAAGIASAENSILSSNMDWQCAEGYVGNLCGSCAPAYGQRGPFRCSKCMPVRAAAALYVIAFIVLLVLIWVMAHVTWLDNQDANSELRISDILKVFVVYVQCMVIITNVPIAWPASIAGVFAALSWLFSAGNSQLLSFDCLVAQVQLSLPVAVVRQLIYLLAPVVMFTSVVLLQCAVRLGSNWSRRRRHLPYKAVMEDVLDRLPVIAIVTLFFFYPSLVRVALSMFACYPIDHPGGLYPQYTLATALQGYWQYDMSQACWVGWHRHWALGLGLPFTLVFCAGVPIGIVLLLWLNRSRHDDLSFRKHCGLLYRLYRKRCYTWEGVVAFQLVVLVLISVFGPNIGVWHETLLINFFFMSFMVVLMMFRPYKFSRLHHIAVFATGCLNFTAYAALSFIANIRDDVAKAYKEAIGAVVLLLNAAFLCWVAYCIIILIKQLLQRIKHARNRSRKLGPEESKDGFKTEAQLVKSPNASRVGVKAGVAAAKALALLTGLGDSKLPTSNGSSTV